MREIVFCTFIICCIVLLVSCSKANSQSKYVQILDKFEQWKAIKGKSGKFLSDKACEESSIPKSGSDTLGVALPLDINISYADINNDSIIDGLVYFHLKPCIKYAAAMTPQIRILILSSGDKYIINDTFVEGFEKKYKNIELEIEGAAIGILTGTSYETKQNDFFNVVTKPFVIDFLNNSIHFDKAKQ